MNTQSTGSLKLDRWSKFLQTECKLDSFFKLFSRKFEVSQGEVDVENNTVIIRDVIVKGVLPKTGKRKNTSLSVTMSNELWASQSFKIHLVPGRVNVIHDR